MAGGGGASLRQKLYQIIGLAPGSATARSGVQCAESQRSPSEVSVGAGVGGVVGGKRYF